MRSRPVRRCNADRKEREGYQRLLAAVFAPEPWEAPKLIERPLQSAFPPPHSIIWQLVEPNPELWN